MSKNGQDRGAQRLRMARQTPRRLEISDAWHGHTRLQQPACYSNRGLGDWANPDDNQASRGVSVFSYQASFPGAYIAVFLIYYLILTLCPG